MSSARKNVYEVELPISQEVADVIGMPGEVFERAVRRCGKLACMKGVTVPKPEPWSTQRDFDSQ